MSVRRESRFPSLVAAEGEARTRAVRRAPSHVHDAAFIGLCRRRAGRDSGSGGRSLLAQTEEVLYTLARARSFPLPPSFLTSLMSRPRNSSARSIDVYHQALNCSSVLKLLEMSSNSPRFYAMRVHSWVLRS